MKGHQDKDKKCNKLLFPAWLNINVDPSAVEFCCEYTKSTTQCKTAQQDSHYCIICNSGRTEKAVKVN
eukprot:3897505-Ditylum_brightwellii.AAC.1